MPPRKLSLLEVAHQRRQGYGPSAGGGGMPRGPHRMPDGSMMMGEEAGEGAEKPGETEKEPGFLELIMRRLMAQGLEEKASTSRDVDEEMNKALPESLSARKALEEDRRRKRMMDEMLREANR